MIVQWCRKTPCLNLWLQISMNTQFSQETYSESKYCVELVSGKSLENGWSDQHGDFGVEFVVEKLTTLFFCT